MQAKDDKAYVECFRQGDFAAFDILFRKYAESLYAFSLSITRNTFAAEEITQLVFMKVWEKRNRINEHLSFRSFLFSVTYFETISWLRKEKSQDKRISEFVKFASEETRETELTVEFKDLENLANRLIDNLPEKRQMIFRLSREQGFTNKEIAEKLGISPKTVENQMTEALKYLREKLAEHHILGLLFYFLLFHF
jgi:RNA polymerase sigma-70 factor (ECF subfamily)